MIGVFTHFPDSSELHDRKLSDRKGLILICNGQRQEQLLIRFPTRELFRLYTPLFGGPTECVLLTSFQDPPIL